MSEEDAPVAPKSLEVRAADLLNAVMIGLLLLGAWSLFAWATFEPLSQVVHAVAEGEWRSAPWIDLSHAIPFMFLSFWIARLGRRLFRRWRPPRS